MSNPAVCAEFCSNKTKVSSARRRLPPQAAIAAHSGTFSLLGDPGRLSILLSLAEDELCVCDLSQVLGAGISAVSHQLRLLRAAGLVACRNQGKMVFYRYTGGPVMVKILRAMKVLAGEKK